MIALNSITRRTQTAATFAEVGRIGVDFSIENINMVQLGRTVDGKIALKSYCSVGYKQTREELLSSPKNLRKIMRQAIKEHGFKGKNIVSSMPSSDVRIFSINYTKSKNNDDSGAILQALRERIDEDLSQYVIDYLPVRASDKEGEQQVLVAVAKHELVISYLELLRYSGLHVEALEIRPAAIKRLIYATQQKQDFKNVLIINFGSDKSYLTITSGRRLLFDYQLNIGADGFIEKMSNVLEMSKEATLDLIHKHGFDTSVKKPSSQVAYVDEDITKTLLDIARPALSELIEEINRVLIFAASENHGEAITKIYLLGSLAHWNGIDKYLDKELKISVKALFDPLEPFYMPSANEMSEPIHAPDMAIAAGLALRGLEDNE